MKLEYFTPASLSAEAEALVQFDMDSIRQVIASRHAGLPDIWLADPALYENNGRLLRDSTSSRLLAYSANDHMIYATDGCNSCARPLDGLTDSALHTLASENEFRFDLLKRLAEMITSS